MAPEMKENIPEGWHTYTLGEIYTERKEAGDPELPILTVSIHSGVSDGALDEEEIGKTVKRIADKTQYKTTRAGDLVFNMMRAWQGAIGVARSDGLVSPAYIVATPDEELVYPLFMDYYMKSPKMIGIINRQSYGVTDFRKRLYWDSFVPIKCTLPSLEEQKKIVAILEKQDKLIFLQREMLNSKQLQKDALMRLFWDGAKGTVVLSDIAAITMGQSPDSTSYNEEMNGIPLVQGNADIKNRYTYPRMYTTAPTKETKPGDILLSVRAPVGTVAKSNINACIGRGVCAINAGELNAYVYQYLLYHEDKWGNVSQGSTFDAISATDIGKLKIPMIDKMAHKVKLLSAYDKEIMLRTTVIEQEQKKKKALMQLLLTGIVRV